VAKFDTDSKMLIKSFLKKVKLQHTDYNMSEQYPQEVKDRRKELFPVMLEARNSGKRAVLVRDKLFIDNVQNNGKMMHREVEKSVKLSVIFRGISKD
jgi:hypothetical protein